MKAFSEMNLNPSIVEALKRINFINATDVQEQVIPIALQGKDIIVRAKTGTGKTASFLVPIRQLSRPSRFPEALIIVPTRELAVQISEVAKKLSIDGRGVAVAYGGASINVQIDALRRNPSLIIGTPGRIIDLIERRALDVEKIRFLVLDEADTMLDIGFIEDLEYILSKTPHDKQTMLFSATMPDKIVQVARRYMHDITTLKIGAPDELVVTKIRHLYAVTEGWQKFATMLAYIKQYNPKKAIIFAQTQYAASAIYEALTGQGYDAILMHGGLTQAKREQNLRRFKGGARFLIATNVAARGIDIAGISDIINFDIPDDPHVYVHRVGRSARMETSGRAFTITVPNDREYVKDIEYIAKITMERIGLDPTPFKHIRVFGKGGAREFRERGGGGGRFGGRGGGSDRFGGRRGGGRPERHREEQSGPRVYYSNRGRSDSRAR